jgi:putative transposase
MSQTPPQKILFHTLDWNAEIEIKARNLPHWFQADAAIFVTFRTSDSLPVQVRLRLVEELRNWLAIHKLPIEFADSVFEAKSAKFDRIFGGLDLVRQREFKKLTSQLLHRSLDESHGECLLRNRTLANIVAEAIMKFDGDRYDLDSFVIMPNHVHAVVQFRGGYGLSVVSQSWMRFTARQINNHIGRVGGLWQPECFDHIIRSDKQFQYLRRYIFENPSKANIPEGQYLYWSRKTK